MSVYKFKIGDRVKTIKEYPLYGTITGVLKETELSLVYIIQIDDYGLHISENENNIELSE